MTGFGRGRAAAGDAEVSVELRSVNHRFLDLSTRLPPALVAAEGRVTSAVRERLARGRVEVHVRATGVAVPTAVTVDRSRYAALLDAMASLTGLPSDDRALRQQAVAWPGVVQAEERPSTPEEDARWLALVERATREALDALVAMRRAEGASLAEVLASTLDAMAAEVAAVRGAAGGLVERRRARLAERLARLVDEGVDEARLLQEAALQADKADIAEELDRLDSHLAQFREVLGRDEPIGRRLEFLVQEANREVNTIGSKAVEAGTRAHVVELKSHLERLREQAANVE